MYPNVRKVANRWIAVFFQWFVVPDVRKVGSVKRRCGGSCSAEWHAAVARSAFSSQNAQNTTFADQFLKLRRRLWREAIVKSKCAKHLRFGAIFEVSMWKNGTLLWREVKKTDGLGPLFEATGTPLWRETNWPVKCSKTEVLGPLFDV